MDPRSIFALVFLTILLGCHAAPKSDTGASPNPGMPKQNPDPARLSQDWKRVDVDGLFFLSLPADMKKQNVRGIDSSVGEYRNERMKVYFDYGIYSNDLESFSDKPDYKEDLKQIGGRKA